MNITIVGCGNIGTQFAVHCAEKGHAVTIFTSRCSQISKELSIVDEDGTVIHRGSIVEATDDPERAFSKAELIFVTTPAFYMEHSAQQIEPYVPAGTYIGLIPGTGGGECAFHKCVEKGCVVFGLQRVPSVARLVSYGESVCAEGYREMLHLAALPCRETENCCRIVSGIFDMPCVALPNYLNVTLTPSNPILHTTRLCTIYNDYKPGKIYAAVPLFYEQWDDASSELLLACDEEVQNLCRAMDMFDLSNVRSLKLHYESRDAKQLTAKLCSIRSLQGLTSPAVAVGGGWIPDFQSRYFTADFPYGLAILIQIAEFAGMQVPHMKQTLAWYQAVTGNRKCFDFAQYGVTDWISFQRFYQQ